MDIMLSSNMPFIWTHLLNVQLSVSGFPYAAFSHWLLNISWHEMAVSKFCLPNTKSTQHFFVKTRWGNPIFTGSVWRSQSKKQKKFFFTLSVTVVSAFLLIEKHFEVIFCNLLLLISYFYNHSEFLVLLIAM